MRRLGILVRSHPSSGMLNEKTLCRYFVARRGYEMCKERREGLAATERRGEGRWAGERESWPSPGTLPSPLALPTPPGSSFLVRRTIPPSGELVNRIQRAPHPTGLVTPILHPSLISHP
ncbi:hypothetical protein E2C01_069700 [Portunus trituberculatus]|uniref:Uncharacterized protein n=1 Tax=Portunus trituberculatus TaxID=210409 RepID=A0A5B7HZL9_PORTR|nr:hypothetical protein [Portunus trituberculatus]